MLRGVHINNLSDPAAWSFVRAARPALVKVVNPDEAVRQLRREVGPDVVIGRVVLDAVDLAPTAEIAAERWYRQTVERMTALHDTVDLWEVPVNETHERGPALGVYAAASAHYVRLAAQDGFRCLVGGFARGTPEPEDFHRFIPALQAAKTHNGGLHLHEYFHRDKLDATWQIGRVQRFYETLPPDLRVPVIISEYGLDNGDLVGRSRKNAGWRDAGYGSAAEYAQDLDAGLAYYEAACPYVVGTCLFNVGDYDNQAWASFDVNDPAIVAWTAKGPRQAPPAPAPEPTPAPDAPRKTETMKLLHPWPFYSQLDDWTVDLDLTDENRLNNCGPECLAMCLKWATGVELPADFIKDALKGPAYIGTTTLSELASFLTRRCEVVTEVVGPGDATTLLRPVVEASITQGYPVIVLFSGNGADLAENIGHFMVVVGVDEAGVVCADPWGGKMRSLSWTRFEYLHRLAQALIVKRRRDDQLPAW